MTTYTPSKVFARTLTDTWIGSVESLGKDPFSSDAPRFITLLSPDDEVVTIWRPLLGKASDPLSDKNPSVEFGRSKKDSITVRLVGEKALHIVTANFSKEQPAAESYYHVAGEITARIMPDKDEDKDKIMSPKDILSSVVNSQPCAEIAQS